MRSMAPAGNETSKKTEKREYILECAQRVFASRGTAGATMQEIALAAGVSKGALYLLFDSKDALYYQLVVTVVDQLLANMQRVAASHGSGYERARALLLTYAHYYAEDGARFRIALGWLAPDFQLNDSLPSAVVYRSHIVQIMGLVVAAVEDGQRDGSIRPELDARKTVLICWGGLLGLLFLRARSADAGPLPPQADAAIWSALGSNGTEMTSQDVPQLIDSYVDHVLSPIRRIA